MPAVEAVIPAAILVVEDDRLLRRNLVRLLQYLGHTVIADVDNGREAIEAIRLAPDLILMDIGLKGDLDGIATAEAIRKQWDGPIIYVTGYSDAETLDRAGAQEPAAYLVKPYDENNLAVAIRIALGNHHRARARRRWFSAFVDHLGGAEEPMFGIDAAGRVRVVNRASEAFLGRPRERIVGRTLEECAVDEPWLEELARGVARVRRHGGTLTVPLGEHQVTITPIGAGPSPLGMLLTLNPNEANASLVCVCSWCRRIRGDRGDWARFEEHFNRAMGMQFTHSICPECTVGLLDESEEAFDG